MSIKARLKAIEGKLPDSREAALMYKPNKTDLLVFDYEEYREAIAAYMMALYVGKPGRNPESRREG